MPSKFKHIVNYRIKGKTGFGVSAKKSSFPQIKKTEACAERVYNSLPVIKYLDMLPQLDK